MYRGILELKNLAFCAKMPEIRRAAVTALFVKTKIYL